MKGPCSGRFPKKVKGQMGGGGSIFKTVDTCFKCFLATESVNGITLPFLERQNRGAFFDAGRTAKMCCKAFIGHKGDLAKSGMETVVNDWLSCKVFDHFMMIIQKPGEKIRSPLVKCLVTSNYLTACGSIFDNLKKEKDVNKYKALKTTDVCRVSQTCKI